MIFQTRGWVGQGQMVVRVYPVTLEVVGEGDIIYSCQFIGSLMCIIFTFQYILPFQFNILALDNKIS